MTWQFWIDRGGTFTDVIGISADGQLKVEKLLSDDPARGSAGSANAAVAAIGKILGQPPSAENVQCVKIGTTVATNALLERKGERTVLITNKGFGDVLRIAYQNRPDIFARKIVLPQPLYECTVEVDCRVSATGERLKGVDEGEVRKSLEQAYADGISACAILFVHGYAFPDDEERVAKLAKGVGFTQISTSNATSGLIKMVGRGDTCVADAYLSPVLRRYVNELTDELGGIPLLFMQSNGGLTTADHFKGKDSLLSGPAGGIVGAVTTCQKSGFDKIISFDMGGTSTDVGHFAGEYESTTDGIIAGTRVRVPMLAVHTVAAGGGSICKFASGRLQVGPESAGANPGPACYGRGGPLTITDCNLLLNRLQPEFFPSVFGQDGKSSLCRDAVIMRLDEITDAMRQSGVLDADGDVGGTKLHADTRELLTAEQLAESFIQIAVEKMANAIKQISIEKGHDLKQYALSSFGGAAGQHACRIADMLGIQTVLCHPLAGVLSAFGIGLSPLKIIKQASVEKTLADFGSESGEEKFEQLFLQVEQSVIDHLCAQGASKVRASAWSAGGSSAPGFATSSEGEENGSAALPRMAGSEPVSNSEQSPFVAPTSPSAHTTIAPVSHSEQSRIRIVRHVHLKYEGTDFSLPVAHDTIAAMQQQFEQIHLERFKFLMEGKALVVDSISVEGTAQTAPAFDETNGDGANTKTKLRPYFRQMFVGGQSRDVHLWKRSMMTDQVVVGPAIIVDSTSTTIVEDGWSASLDPTRTLVLTRVATKVHTADTAAIDRPDPARLELFNHAFMAIAEQMGAALQSTSYSINIKERLDFSCAVFDATGALIANAPHIPVHLGSMSECVRSIIRSRGKTMKNGDAYVSNDPFSGGTHLPDITVVSPIFCADVDEPAFFTAARGHHADVGGITPGSMPAFSRSLEEEGVVIQDFLLVRDGHFHEDEMIKLLESGRFPARLPQQNVADLRAQVAANVRGGRALNQLVEAHGLATVRKYMRFIQENACQAVRRALTKLKSGSFLCTMDDGAKIDVQITVDHSNASAIVDFSNSSTQHPLNRNAPPAITRAAVMYVMRTLIDENIPLNDGFLDPITIKSVEGSILSPKSPAAIVAGNVETSQQITDALYGALNAMAASQGTMNNFTFGTEKFQYYETIAGGSGAGPDFDGASAVQTNMTNSRLTDPEVLELRFPVLLEEFSVRKGSGGAGEHHGGDGVVRRIKFLQPVSISILSERRVSAPHGLNGGAPGQCGKNYIIKADDTRVDLASSDTAQLDAGDSIVIETPGGGGYGAVNWDHYLSNGPTAPADFMANVKGVGCAGA